MGKLATLLIACTLLLACAPPLAAQVTVAGPEGDCGFSKLRPSRMTHFVQRGAVTKATPQYPPAAKAKGLSATVRVRILINKHGLVERTCPEYVKGEPKPDRSLVIAAEAAALQWIFDRNFGIEPSRGIHFDYVEDVLVFKFVPEEPNKDNSKHESDDPKHDSVTARPATTPRIKQGTRWRP